MRQRIEKLKSRLGKKRGRQPGDSLAATPSGESTPPNERTPSTSGVPIPPNQPALSSSVTTVSPNNPILTSSVVAASPNEPMPNTPALEGLTTEPTVALPHLTAPAPETAIPPNETADPPSQLTSPALASETKPPGTFDLSPRERDFWKEAFAMLPKRYKVPKGWETSEFDKTDVVALVNDRKKECESKQWKFTINGKEVVIRDLFAKTLHWVQKFAVVGDTAIQYDPLAAAPYWAAVRGLLQMAANETETYCAMIAGLERATWLAFYCSAQERLYKDYFADNQKYSGLNDAFVRDLVHLYAATLKFLIEADNYYDKNTTVRIVTSTFTPSTWVTELMKAIDDRKVRMEEYASLVHKSNVHEDLKSILSMLEPFSKYKSEAETRRKEKERREFMKWLSDVDYRADHLLNSRNILPHSGNWIDTDGKFCNWKDGGTLLWLRGFSGAGKTKLTSTVIDHLMKTDEKQTVAYFYCTRNTKQPRKEDPEEILRAILKQLVIILPSQLSHRVKAKYEEEKRKGGDHGSLRSLTFQECADFILEISTSRPVTIVIDALDECRENKPHSSQGSHTDRQDLLEKLIVTDRGNIKVFLSSRDVDDIRSRLQIYPIITLDDSKNGLDIRRFIEFEVDDLMTKKIHWGRDEILRGDIVRAVDDRAKGMFRFAALQIGHLRTLTRKNIVRERLQKLPGTLCEIYDEIYQRISTMNDEESSIAKRALSWLLCARRQLLSGELLAAVSLDPDAPVTSDELLRICRDLIVLNEAPEAPESFELAHLSVREYLEEHKEYKDGQPHTVVAEQCIKLFEPEVPRGILDQYASLYWPDHYNSRPQAKEDTLTDMVKNLFRDKGANPAFENWARIAKDSRESLPLGDDLHRRLAEATYKPLSVVCVFGFPKLLDQWMDNTPGYSYFRDSEDMVVQLAIKWGNAEVVHLLLQTDAQPTIDKLGWTCSFWAAIYKRKPVLGVLKRLHGYVDATDDLGWTALHWMVFLGRVEGVEMLLSVGAESIVAEEAKWTPLHWAAFLDREAETQALVKKHGLDSDDSDGLTPFQWATFLKHGKAAKILWTSQAGDSLSSGLRLSASNDSKVRGAK